MVVLGRWLFLMSEVPLYSHCSYDGGAADSSGTQSRVVGCGRKLDLLSTPASWPGIEELCHSKPLRLPSLGCTVFNHKCRGDIRLPRGGRHSTRSRSRMNPLRPASAVRKTPALPYDHRRARDTPAVGAYRGTSLIRNSAPLGLYSRIMPRALWGS